MLQAISIRLSFIGRLAAGLLFTAFLTGVMPPQAAQASTITTLHEFSGQANGATPTGCLALGSDGAFYGTTTRGGASDRGTFYKISGGVYTVLHSFSPTEGSDPAGSLTQGADGAFYGVTRHGGGSDQGTIYKITSAGILTVLHTFTGSDGGVPSGGLVLGTDGDFYGVTQFGGKGGHGAVFMMTPRGGVTILHFFNGADGGNPTAALLFSNGVLYGATETGGTWDFGAVFQLTRSGGYTLLHSFSETDGGYPSGPLAVGGDGNFYGVASSGGGAGDSPHDGVVYRISSAGAFTLLHAFSGADGSDPIGRLVVWDDGALYGVTFSGGSDNFGTIYKITTAGVLTTLHALTGSEGSRPDGGLALGSDGNFYGTARAVGAAGGGTAFQVTPAGALTVQHTFSGTEGVAPFGGLVQGLDGNFYGTTVRGGMNDLGAVYQITPAGASSVIHSFSGQDGACPHSGLMLGPDGNFYGTTAFGGTGYAGYSDLGGSGVVFKISAAGAYTILHTFNGGTSDGSMPFGGLVIAADHYFYGTTLTGGQYGYGTVFKMNINGSLNVIYSFNATDGSEPYAKLVQGTDNALYGSTTAGGANLAGVIFKITTSGTLTVLHSMAASEGSIGSAALIQAADGNFYGTTYNGGANGGGTVFKMTSGGTLTQLYSFKGYDGAYPDAGLVQTADGNLYGTTAHGGDAALGPYAGEGTLFQITTAGVLTVLAYFMGNTSTIAGANPVADLCIGTDGSLYGTTSEGGFAGHGTVFKITPSPPGSTLTWDVFYPVFPTIHAGQTQQFTVIALDQNFGPVSPQPVITWSASGGTVNSAGLFTAGSTPGLYGVTAAISAGSVGEPFLIDTDPLVTGAVISPSDVSLLMASTQQFSAYSVDGSGTSLGLLSGPAWSTSGGGAVNSSGLFTAGGASGGPFTISALGSGHTGTATVTVGFVPVVTSITVTPSNASVASGGTRQFSAVAYDQNGTPMPAQPGFTWTVSGGGTIDPTGLFTASGPPAGPFTVTAATLGVSGTTPVMVTFAPVLSTISVAPISASVVPGGTKQFTATGKDQNGGVLSPQPAFTWAVTGINSISTSGLFTAGGTTGGPFTITASSGSVYGTASVRVASAPILDFNGDGKADIVLQSTSANKAALWYLNGTAVSGGAYLSTAPPAGWKIVGAGDFNGDNKPDIVLQNATTRQVAFWYLNGATVTGGQYISTIPSPGWSVIGVGDFNGDGKLDLALQNATTRQIAIWYLNGTTLLSGAYVSSIPTNGWSATGVGDFNGDGKPDLVLQNTATRQISLWYLNNATVLSGPYLGSALPAGWSIAGVGDVNADATADLVLQNATTNQVAFWYISGTTVTGGAYLATTPPAGWSVVAPK